MTYAELNTVISGIGLPYAYYQFPDKTEQEPPFICFFFTGSDDLFADDKNYAPIRPLAIELYTDNKDFDKEKLVEDALATAGLAYSRDETWLDAEHMNMVVYTTEIVVTEATTTSTTEVLK